MKTNKNIPDDLNYLSEMGYEQFPNTEADLKQLKKRFSDKNGIQISGTFISLSIGLFLGLTLMFTILNKPNLGTSIKESENLISEIKEPTPNTIQLDTVTVNKNVIVTKTHEKYEEPIINNSNQETLVGEKLEKVNVTNIINENTEPNKLKFSENAPVIFLHDLKVANYHLYYFKGQGLVNVSFNVEAAYQNNTDKKNTIVS
ncbi:MAG: hypothetical protein JNM96_08110, partial [Bacteroidia bacterium]|nr:hypothetical protein [Bacteroidia bacterium]